MTTRPHPNVMAARGMTRHALDWLAGDAVDSRPGSPFAISWPGAAHADTPVYADLQGLTGDDGFSRTLARFDTALAVSTVRHARDMGRL